MAKGKRSEVVEQVKEQVQEQAQEQVQKKGYKFVSPANAYLYVGTLGVQFRKGEFVTDDEALAEQLRKIQGVEEVK